MRLRPLPIILAFVIALCLLAVLFVTISYFRYSSDRAVAGYIRSHPGDVAIACADPLHPETGFYHNADDAYPLASSFKLILMAAYADQVANGGLDPQEIIPLAEVEKYYLPGTDGDAHSRFLESLGAGRETLTLSEVVDGMIVYSSNAAADYLGSRLKDVDFPALYARLELEHTDLPFSYLGLYLFMTNHETGPYAEEEITLEEARAEQTRLEQLYVKDPAWRQAEIDFLHNQGNFAPVPIQKQVLHLFGMSGSARDLTRVMLAAYGYNDALSDDAQEIMGMHLSWPLRMDPSNVEEFDVLATKSGAWPGVLTSVWYAEPAGTEEARVLSVLYRSMPDDYWNAWLVSFSHQVLETKVLTTADCSLFSDALQ
jgi:D-alanyl-D-alanine carboxypeptidase